MNINLIAQKLKLQSDDILNCFVIGSRVWGNAHSDSDWDGLIVTKCKNERKSVSVDNIDAVILSNKQWQKELKRHRFECWLTLFLPTNAIWKQQCNFDNSLFDYNSFVNAMHEEIDEDITEMKKRLQRKNTKKYKKYSFIVYE